MAKTAKKKTGMSAEFSKQLKAANKLWKTAKAKAAEAGVAGGEFPDGKYLARLTKAAVGKSQGGRLQCAFHFKIEDGEYEGQVKVAYDGLETEQNLEYFAKRVTQLGYDVPDSLEEIAAVLEDIGETKPLCMIRLRSSGDFQNVYIQKVLGDDEEVESDEDEDDANTETDDTEESDEEEEDEEETEEEEEPAPKKKKAKAAPEPPAKKKKAPPVEEEEEAEDESDEEDEEDEGEDVQLEAGMAVIAATSKGDRPGKILEVLEDEGKVRIKFTDGEGPKVIRVATDKLSLPEEEEEEEDVPDEPAPKAKKKTAKK